jgi:hypothetical protein
VTGPLHVSSNLPTENALKRFFPCDSEMALPMREFDWAPSRLGAAENWPQSRRTAQGICLTSRFPLHLYWGTELTLFYNDACIPFLGPAKHPALLGRSGRDAWAGGWDSIGPMIENIFSTGEAGCYEDIPGFFDRDLPREQVFVNFSFSPVIGSTGFFAPVQKPPVNRPAIGGSKRFVGRTRGLPSGTVLVWFAWRGVVWCGVVWGAPHPTWKTCLLCCHPPEPEREAGPKACRLGADDDRVKSFSAREVTARVATYLKHSKLKKSLNSVSVKSGQDHFLLIT